MNEQGEEIEESLQIHAFLDNSVLEVFVNERSVISTRIYHPRGRCFGMRFFAESIETYPKEVPAVLLSLDVWDGLGKNSGFIL